MALESFSPVQLLAIRFTVSGSLLLLAAKFWKAHLPSGRELLFTALFGVLTLGIGNGCLAYAEEFVPSGLAAIFVTVSPFWMVGFEALLPGGVRLHGPTIAGMMVGLLGTVLLVGPSAIQHGFGGPILAGFLLLQFGSCGWAFGSILQRRYPTRAHPVVSGAVQQLATGLVYAVPALTLRPPPIHWSGRGSVAVIYLVFFGSIVGYSAYLYTLEHLPVSIVTIYNYINPVVAVFLGWLFYREPFGLRELAAMGIIFTGVALVKRFSHPMKVVQPAAREAQIADSCSSGH
jgi:drug/metabolite transporter (DMT)-like permease